MELRKSDGIFPPRASGASADRNESWIEEGRRDRGTTPRMMYIAGVVQTRTRDVYARVYVCVRAAACTYTNEILNAPPDARAFYRIAKLGDPVRPGCTSLRTRVTSASR